MKDNEGPIWLQKYRIATRIDPITQNKANFVESLDAAMSSLARRWYIHGWAFKLLVIGVWGVRKLRAKNFGRCNQDEHEWADCLKCAKIFDLCVERNLRLAVITHELSHR